jgi:hypothetical protein
MTKVEPLTSTSASSLPPSGILPLMTGCPFPVDSELVQLSDQLLTGLPTELFSVVTMELNASRDVELLGESRFTRSRP